MKRFSMRKAVAGAALVTGLLVGVAAPKAAQAHYVERVEGDWAWVRYTVKGAQGPLVRVRRQDVGKYVSVRSAQREAGQSERVASFRVETDEQGRQWVYVHPRTKGADGAGWVRVPLRDLR
jgi:hypothetical protein